MAAGELLGALANAMAPLEAELVEADLRGMAAAALDRTPRRSLVVLFTGLEAATVEEGLVPVLGSLLRRHRVLLAAVSDPAVAGMAAGRADAREVYAAAAAERARAGRRRTAEALTRRGVEVVDAVPDQLAPAVADAYLALKATGRL